MTKRDEILERVHGVPALPPAAVRALELVFSPDVSVQELRAAVENDPGLTSNLLRIANAAYFKGVGEILSVRDAIVRLGTRAVVHMVLTSAIAPVARRAVVAYDLPRGALLVHSIAVALTVELLGERLGLALSHAAFTAGLLHDLGKMVLGTHFGVDAAPILELAVEGNIPFEQAERQLLGADHAEVGAELLRAWRLPTAVVDVVRWHHAPDLYHHGPDRDEVDVVHLSNVLARSAGFGVGRDGLHYVVSARAATRLRVSNEAVESILNEVHSRIKALEGILGLESEA